MKLFLLLFLSVSLSQTYAEDYLQSKTSPLSKHSSEFLELIKKYHPKFPIGDKIITYYKQGENYKITVLQELESGIKGESTFLSIPQFANNASFSFDHGTGYNGNGIFSLVNQKLLYQESICGTDICSEKRYENGKLISNNEVMVSPYLPSKKDKLNFSNLEKIINKKYNKYLHDKEKYSILNIKSKDLDNLITVPRDPVFYEYKITKKDITYYTYNSDIKIIQLNILTNDDRESSATIYIDNDKPFYIFQKQVEKVKVLKNDATCIHLSNGSLLSNEDFEVISDNDGHKYAIVSFGNNRLYYNTKGILFKVSDDSFNYYRGSKFDGFDKVFESIMKEVISIVNKHKKYQSR